QTSGAFTPDLTAEPDGTYVLEVALRDAAGNTSTASLAYRLDRTAPALLAFTERPGSPSSAAQWTWDWTPEPGTTSSCSLTGPGGASALSGPCGPGTSVSTAALDE